MSDARHDPSAARPLTARQSERRARILDAAQVLLAEHGYDGVSMRMIAERAGVAERTLFNIYSSRDALIAMSARDRSSGIIAEAWDNAPDPGTGFLLTLCQTLTRYTLVDRDMARALAPVLIRESNLVGLHDIYRDFVGRSLASLAAEGNFREEAVGTLPSLIAMNVVSIVVQWAAGLIEDEALETHFRLTVGQVVLPHASGELECWAGELARSAVARIAAVQDAA